VGFFSKKKKKKGGGQKRATHPQLVVDCLKYDANG
jgi:hypothetical protein